MDHQLQKKMQMPVVETVQRGQRAELAADLMGVSHRTMSGWMARHRTGGRDALRARPVAGRPPML